MDRVYIHCTKTEMSDVAHFVITDKLVPGVIDKLIFIMPAIAILNHYMERVMSKEEYIALLNARKLVYVETGKYDMSTTFECSGKCREATVDNLDKDLLYKVLIKNLEKIEAYEKCANLKAAYEHICEHSL